MQMLKQINCNNEDFPRKERCIMSDITKLYEMAKENYSQYGVDVDKAVEILKLQKVSLNAWQLDDVRGFLNLQDGMSGGIMSTGSYMGLATTPDQLREDAQKAFSLIPGKHKISLQATQVDTHEKIDLNEIEAKHYKSYVDWAKEIGVGLDFNPSCYSHPMSATGFTLSSPEKNIRDFWIEHCKRASKIGEYFGEQLGIKSVTNHWIPDGYKDIPVDRLSPRQRLADSLDEIFKNPVDQNKNLDTIECKLFGIGVEAYTVGSHEFYLGYALKNNRAICLDAGHFHLTENIADKISSIMMNIDEILLHVTRPMRWDSDHVVSFDDNTKETIAEVVRNNWLGKIHIGTDFFDASINRVAASVIGMRNTLKAILTALLEPTEILKKLELEGDYTQRLALLEELKTMPFSSVWDYFCLSENVPVGNKWIEEIKAYEVNVLSKR